VEESTVAGVEKGQHRGLEAARPLIEAMVVGKADPREGHIVVLE
jgi:hypothetical protein